jgi:hypothetical protein
MRGLRRDKSIAVAPPGFIDVTLRLTEDGYSNLLKGVKVSRMGLDRYPTHYRLWGIEPLESQTAQAPEPFAIPSYGGSD